MKKLTSQIGNVEFWVKWTATAVIMAAVALTSGNWLYPWNILLYFIGNILWIWAGVIWRQWPVIITNLFANIILVAGYIIKNWI
jgi:hypothetical protein